MNVVANPLSGQSADTALAEFLAALESHRDRVLAFAYEDGHWVRGGYHVTEVKSAALSALDCGGNPDEWHETVLQVEDLPPTAGSNPITGGRLASILSKVSAKIVLDQASRLTVEISRPGEAMRVCDVAGVDVERDRAVVRLVARSAICKPRHRAGRAATAEACRTPANASAPARAVCCA